VPTAIPFASSMNSTARAQEMIDALRAAPVILMASLSAL
jgi:hypothetical protein